MGLPDLAKKSVCVHVLYINTYICIYTHVIYIHIRTYTENMLVV